MASQVQVRLSLEETFMRIAFEWSHRSTCSSRVAVGAVIVNPLNQIIASGYNGSPRGFEHCNEVGCTLDSSGHCVRAIHAETNAIIQCAQSGVSTLNTKIFVTHSPCLRCAGLIVQAGIKEVVYAWEYKNILETISLFGQAGISFRMFKIQG